MKVSSLIYPAKGKLNYDDSLTVMPLEDSRYRLNTTEKNDGDFGVLTNEMGNTLVNLTNKPWRPNPVSITYTTVGGPTTYVFTFTDTDFSKFINYTFLLSTDAAGADYKIIPDTTSTITTLFNFVNYIYNGFLTYKNTSGDSQFVSVTRSFSLGITEGTITVVLNPGTLRNIEIKRRNTRQAQKAVGFREDPENTAGIYFLKSPDGYDSIIRYNKLTNDFTYILSEENFLSLGTHVEADIIGDGVATQDGEGQLLCWVDGSAPKKLNITKAINYTLGIGTPAYTTMDVDTITAGAMPPLEPFSVSYLDTANNINYIRGKIYQFAHYFIYDDDEKSVLSPYSRITIPEDEEKINGVYAENIKKNGRIRLQATISDEKVKKIGICYRLVDDGTGIPSDFYLYDVVEKTSSAFTYYFYGDKEPQSMDQTDVMRQYDTIPIAASRQSVINDTILSYGDITEGYDLVNTNTSLQVLYKQGADLIYPSISNMSAAIVGSEIRVSVPEAMANIEGMYSISITTPTATYKISIESNYKNGVIYSLTQIIEMLKVRIINLGDSAITSVVRVLNSLMITHTGGVSVYGHLFNTVHKYETIKSGTVQYYGIVYYDKLGRNGFVNEIGSLYIPFNTETSLANNTYYIGTKYSLKHTPPAWAYYYQIVNKSNSDSEQYLIKKSDIVRSNGVTKLKINSIVSNTVEKINGCKLVPYEFAEGDRVRFIGYNDLTGDYTGDETTTYFDEYIDVEVMSQDEDYVYIKGIENYISLVTVLNSSYTYQMHYILIEVIRYRNSGLSDIIYNEISEVYEIGNPTLSTRYHKKGRSDMDVTAQDQNPSDPINTPATGVVRGGYYVRSRLCLYGDNVYLPFIVETKSISDYYYSEGDSKGRRIVVNANTKQQRRNILRYGGSYKDNSGLNFVFKFPSSNIVSLDDRYGRIYNIQQIGDTLIVRQQSKVTSFYLGMEMAKDASGNNVLVYSDSTIGSPNQSREEYGTIHPKSCQKALRNTYFVDVSNSEVVRDSVNGLEPIGSAFKMKSYFKTKIAEIKSLASYDIACGVDRGNRMYYVTFIDNVDGAKSETIRFSEDENAWKSFHSFVPEMYGSIGEDTLLAFKNGFLYIQNSSSANRCTYFGTKYSQYVHAHCNENSLINKLWLSVGVNSNKQWYLNNDDDVEIQPNDKYPYGMSSKILDFENEEGIYVADFLSDMLTNATTSTDYDTHDLHNGRDMFGKEITMKLHNTHNTEVNLSFVIVNALV